MKKHVMKIDGKHYVCMEDMIEDIEDQLSDDFNRTVEELNCGERVIIWLNRMIDKYGGIAVGLYDTPKLDMKELLRLDWYRVDSGLSQNVRKYEARSNPFTLQVIATYSTYTRSWENHWLRVSVDGKTITNFGPLTAKELWEKIDTHVSKEREQRKQLLEDVFVRRFLKGN